MNASIPVLLSAGAARAAIDILVAEGAWGEAPPDIVYGTAGAVRDRIIAGEHFDATVLSAEAMAAIAARGLVAPATIARLGEAGLGIAVRQGLDMPGIGSQAGLLAVLDAARSIAWPDPQGGATAGRHFATVLDRLGIAARVRAKSRLYPNGSEAVAACERGEVDITVTQATEIAGSTRVRLHGRFPAPYAPTTAYVIAAAPDSEAGRGIVAVLMGAPGRAALASVGFMVPPA